MSDELAEIRAAAKYLWETAPWDNKTAEALMVVLPIVDEWIERRSPPLSLAKIADQVDQ